MTNMNVNNPPVIDECQVIKTWLFSQNADGSLSPAVLGGGGGGGVVTQGTVPWVISGAITNPFLDFSLATIDNDIKSNVTLHAGTNVIGKVSQDTSPWVVSAADGTVFVRSNAAATFPVTATQGPANTLANAWSTKITDGTNGPVAVKAASTAAAATDPSLVVQLSPNQPNLTTPLNDNVAQWGGVAVSAPPAASTPPTGAEVAPVTRPIVRKKTTTLSTTPLNAGATFTSPWIDTNADGTVFVESCVSADQNGTQTIVQTDDTAIAGLQQTVTSLNFSTVNPPGTAFISGVINKRYYQISFHNTSGSNQTSFELVSTAFNHVMTVGVVGSGAYSLVGATLANAVPVGLCGTSAANEGTQSYVLMSPNGTGGILGVGVSAFTSNSGSSSVLLRTPNIFKDKSTVTASGDTAVWTPTTGKKFRVMRFMIAVQGLSTTSAGGAVAITLRDATTAILHTFNINVPATALTGAALLYESNWIDLGNGYLSAVANNVLNVNLGTAFTAGGVDVFVIGCEE